MYTDRYPGYEPPTMRCAIQHIDKCIAVSTAPSIDPWSEGNIYDWE